MKTVHIVLSLLRADSPCHWPASTLSTRRFAFPFYYCFPLWQGANCVLFPPAYGRSLNQNPPFRGGNNAVIASQVRKYPSPSSEPGQITKIKLRGCTLIGIVVGLGEGNCFQMGEKGEKTHNSAPCGLAPDTFQGRIGYGVATARSACLFLVGSRDARVNLHHPERGVAPVDRPQNRPGVARPHGLVARFCCVWPGLVVRRAFLSGIRFRSNAGLRWGRLRRPIEGGKGFVRRNSRHKRPQTRVFRKVAGCGGDVQLLCLVWRD